MPSYEKKFESLLLDKNLSYTEGDRGRSNLEKVLSYIGYESVDNFLEDNPGAIESLYDFIVKYKIGEEELDNHVDLKDDEDE